MPDKWKIRAGEFMDALSIAGIKTAADLAELAGIAKGTAERLMRGQLVSRATVIAVCATITKESGTAFRASDLFEVAA